jgi:hypothetical protein
MFLGMDMTPLALVVLLGYGLLIAIALTAWTATSADRSIAGSTERSPRSGPPKSGSARQEPSRQSERAASNNDVRGARAAERVRPRRAADQEQPFEQVRVRRVEQEREEDAFERFLKARPDDIDIR